VLVTHDVGRGLALADQVLVLRAGRLVMGAPTAGLDPAAFRAEYEALVG
jgi:phosphonate transport system ATP-binding protein